MRNPVRSEADAFHIVVGSAAVIAVSVVLGALLGPPVGVALLVGAAAGAVIWEVATVDPDRRRPLRDAAADGRRTATEGRRRVLVVANRTLATDELRAELRRHAAEGTELHVVAPILASRVHYIASDIDRELQDARDRLRAALTWAEANGVTATGRVGDPNAALDAIEDELRRFSADEVLIATLPPDRSNWLETGILARLRAELDCPVTHLVAEPEAHPVRGAAARATP
jgi:alkanesulfonate monooxygenase SsuD/methylene tetrahydromethanopterin reductase-like flavin-dependent oxidoreductase (luciferase family)